MKNGNRTGTGHSGIAVKVTFDVLRCYVIIFVRSPLLKRVIGMRWESNPVFQVIGSGVLRTLHVSKRLRSRGQRPRNGERSSAGRLKTRMGIP